MRYRWTIKTGDAMYAGTDSSVFLSLAGLDASMREVEISDPDTINDWEKGDQNHGVIETCLLYTSRSPGRICTRWDGKEVKWSAC